MTRLLFVTLRPFYPEMAGGAELTHLHLFRGLLERGCEVEAICFRDEASSGAGEPREEDGSVLDESLGFPCLRLRPPRMHARCRVRRAVIHGARRFGVPAPERLGCLPAGLDRTCRLELEEARAVLQRRVAAFRPDAVLGHYGTFPLLAELHAVGIPAYYYVHDAWSVRGLDRYRESIRPIASSPFVASEVRRVAGLDAPLVLPAIDLDACRIQGVRERGTVTFINPVPKKGVEMAIEVARRMPDVPFLFVEGGWFRHARRPAVRRVARRADRVPNITRQSFESDVRKIYARTDVLIVPSPSESFPRVVIEAQSNGIPVIAKSTPVRSLV